MWYKNSYRRHLLDMHINDWGEGIFLRDFSPENYVENLKTANVKSAMIYLQSHVGFSTIQANQVTPIPHFWKIRMPVF